MKQLGAVAVVVLLMCGKGNAQNNIWKTTQSRTSFYSKALLEDITALNNAATSAINTATNEVVVRIPIKQFDFPNNLMEEHFNENYLESDKYPFATFQGKIKEAIDWQQAGKKEVSAEGVLNIHGVNQPRTLSGTLLVAPGKLQVNAQFMVRLADHKIKVPKLVFQKIAETIDVNCQFVYETK